MNSFIHRCIITFIAGLSLFVIAGCSSVPYSGRYRAPLLVSEAQERELGQQAWNEIRKKEKVSNNKQYNEALTRVGNNLAKAINQPGFNWEFVVFDSATPNAFCLPGGKVGVYSGLFKYTANDAELASVVGHEIAHAVARHGGERMTNTMLQQGGAQLLETTMGNDQRVMTAYGIASNVGVMLPYSRTHEYEADYLGLIFLAKAGYSPQEALSFWKKFGELSKINALQEFLSTHPAGGNRIQELQKKLPEAEKIYQQAPIKRGLGITY